MTKELAHDYLSRCNGDWSVFYPILKDEIAQMNLSDEEFFGIQEICFFESDYLMYYLDILENGFCQRKIIDIGCQHGFQQVIFDDFEYIGIEIDAKMKLFRDHGQFIMGDFTELDIDLSDSIVISNMSLGYFNLWINKTDKQIADKLAKADRLYIQAPQSLISELEHHFPTKRIIRNKKILGNVFRAFYFAR